MMMFIYFIIAVGVSFLCSILEAVLLSITPTFIELQKQERPLLGKLLEKQKKQINLSIGAILTLNTFAHTLGASGVGAEAAKMFGEAYMFYVSAILTILILVFSEIIPKTIGAYYWKELAGLSARIIEILVFLTYPLVIVMNKLTQFIERSKEQKRISREEIAVAASIGEEAGVLKEQESDVIENLLQFSDMRVKDIYTPRSVLFCLSKECLLKNLQEHEDNIDITKFKEYSRVPIYGEDIDDIKGYILAKEYFHEFIANELKDKEELIKPLFSVNENLPISNVLDLFMNKKAHLFLVTDNYGQTEGVVSLEDVMETLLGQEIVDELDKNIDMRELAKQRMKILRHNI